MAYRKKTLRTMSPTARKVARLVGEQVSVALRLKNLIPDLQKLDSDARALATAADTTRKGQHDAYATTLDYIKNQWPQKTGDLSRIPSNHLEWWLRGRMKETAPIEWEKDKDNEVHAVHDPITQETIIE